MAYWATQERVSPVLDGEGSVTPDATGADEVAMPASSIRGAPDEWASSHVRTRERADGERNHLKSCIVFVSKPPVCELASESLRRFSHEKSCG